MVSPNQQLLNLFKEGTLIGDGLRSPRAGLADSLSTLLSPFAGMNLWNGSHNARQSLEDRHRFYFELLKQAELSGERKNGIPPLEYINSPNGLLRVISEQTDNFTRSYTSPTGLKLTPCGSLLAVDLPPGLAQRNNCAVRDIFDPKHIERSYGHVACGSEPPSENIFLSHDKLVQKRLIRVGALNTLRHARIGSQGERVKDRDNISEYSLIACGLDAGNGNVIVQIMPRHCAALAYMGRCLQGKSRDPISQIIEENRLLAIVLIDPSARQVHWDKVNEFRTKEGTASGKSRKPFEQEQVIVHSFIEPSFELDNDSLGGFGDRFKGTVNSYCEHPGTAVKKAVFGIKIIEAIREEVTKDGNPFFPWHGSAAKWVYSHHNVLVELTGEAGSGKTELWYNLAWLNARLEWLETDRAELIELYKNELSSWGLTPEQFELWFKLIPNGVDGRGDDILHKERNIKTGETWVHDNENGTFHRPDVAHEIKGVQKVADSMKADAEPMPVAGYGLIELPGHTAENPKLQVDLTNFTVNPRMCIPGRHIPGRSSEPLRPQISIIGIRGGQITDKSTALCNAAIQFISRNAYAAMQAKTPTAGKGDNNPSALVNPNDGLIKGSVGSIGDFIVPKEHPRAYLQMLRVMIPPQEEQVKEGGIIPRNFVAARGAIGTRANLNTVGVGALQALCRDSNWEMTLSNPKNLIWTDPLGGFCLKPSATDPLLIDGELFRPWEQENLGIDKWWESRELLHRYELDALKEHLENINLLPEVRAGKVEDIDHLRGFIEKRIEVISYWLDNSDKFKADFKTRISSEDSSLPEDQKMRDEIKVEFKGQVNFN